MKSTSKMLIITGITLIFSILMSLWLFTKASEDIDNEIKYYKSYRNNILGIAGDFAVFAYDEAYVSEVTADVAVGGDFWAVSFGNYDKKWNFYKDNDLRFINQNSYIRGQYKSGDYKWNSDLYLYTGNGKNTINEETQNNSYNVIGVDYEFIDFENEFKFLNNLSKDLMDSQGQAEIDCIPKENEKTYTYQFPEEENVVIIKVDSEKFFNKAICESFNIEGLSADKKIVINIDCNGKFDKITPRIQINGSPEDWNYLSENVILNFYAIEQDKDYIVANGIMGTVLAPNFNIYVNSKLNGSIIARKVVANNPINGINSSIRWEDVETK